MALFCIELNSLGEALGDGSRITVLPLGDIIGRDGRAWRLDANSAQSLVDRIVSDGIDIVIDFDHGTYWGRGKAAGWLTDFQVEENAVTAKLEYTEQGRASVDAKEYRYLSPSFYSDGPHILRLDSVALTNTPNLRELPALNNVQQGQHIQHSMGDTMAKPDAQPGKGHNAVSDAAGVTPQQNATGTANETDSIPEGVKAELNELRESRRDLLVQVNTLQGQLARMGADGQQVEINTLVENAIKDGKLVPAQRDSALKLGEVDRNALEQLIGNSAQSLQGLGQPTPVPAGVEDDTGGLSAEDLQVCRMMGMSQETFQNNRKEEMKHGA